MLILAFGVDNRIGVCLGEGAYVGVDVRGDAHVDVGLGLGVDAVIAFELG